ncbi:sensor histidine kinase [Nonomuraea sp. NPDC049725]|uniref:sensor histidine kinase n=1 Tax=Nonomuraea sp. NPDC049725 TaxID=3154508 RepID=UPI0034152691
MTTRAEEAVTIRGERRQQAADLGLAMVVLVVVGTAISANVGSAGAEPPVAAYGFGLLLSGLMFVRRRWPVATLVVTAAALLVYYLLSYPPVGLAVPVAAALYSAAEQGKLRWAVGTAVALLVISTTARTAHGDDPAYLYGFELATSVGLMAAVIALGDTVRSRRGWRAELDKQARAARAEREREAARRVGEERLRIARDLHDLLGHTISVISLHTDVAREALRDDPDAAERSLAVVRDACGDVVAELRASLRALREPPLADQGRLAPTRGLADQGRVAPMRGLADQGRLAPVPGLDRLDELARPAREAGLEVGVSVRGTPVPLPAVADATAYRVVQEALVNVLKHAEAHRVEIELAYGEEALVVRVTDDGKGGPGEGKGGPGEGKGGFGDGKGAPGEGEGLDGGWGIMGMRERVGLLGGTLRVSSRPSEGFEVEARVPYGDRT